MIQGLVQGTWRDNQRQRLLGSVSDSVLIPVTQSPVSLSSVLFSGEWDRFIHLARAEALLALLLGVIKH